MKHHLIATRLAALFLLLTPWTGASLGCSTGAEVRDDEPEGVMIGRPPAKDDDPFADAVLPPGATPAPTSGFVGDGPKPMPDGMRAATRRARPPVVKTTPNTPKTTPTRADPSPGKTGVSAKPSIKKPSITAPSATARKTQLGVAVDTRPTATPDPPPDQAQCFSCVVVCSEEDAAKNCANSAEDMICGWGTAKDRRSAQKLAQAQCDAALDMARSMPMWRSIQGRCPEASCRE